MGMYKQQKVDKKDDAAKKLIERAKLDADQAAFRQRAASDTGEIDIAPPAAPTPAAAEAAPATPAEAAAAAQDDAAA